MSPFDFVKAINETKENLLDSVETDYVPFVVNKQLSYFHDTVMFANEVNKHYDMPKDQQFEFLLGSIKKRKRFAKWAKPEADADLIVVISQHFGYNVEHAKEVERLMTDTQKKELKDMYYIGGRQ